MQRRTTIELEVPAAEAEGLVRTALALDPELTGRLPGDVHAVVRASVVPTPGGCRVALVADQDLTVPFFGPIFRLVDRYALRRGLRHSAAAIRAAADGTEPPAPIRPSPVSPPAPFDEAQIDFLATAAMCAAIASFGAALFGQNGDAIARSFDVSDAGLGTALAITRIGVLMSLVAAVAADRVGRRRVILWSVLMVGVANAVSGLASSFGVFTGSQLVLRAAVNSALVVGGIAVVEEAPDGARAWAVAMLSLAAGAGFACAVALLPLADGGRDTWRIAFGISAVSLLLLPTIRRRLPETTRFRRVAGENPAPLRLREIFDPAYGRRFLLLAVIGFLTSMFSAPSAQLTNRYLADERGFSASGIAALRGDVSQRPSAVSAIKVGGRRAYQLAREGRQVELAARDVRIDRFDVLSIRRDGAFTDVDVAVDCSSGTYIRALARDLGEALGVGGHLTALRRTRVGGYGLDHARTLETPELVAQALHLVPIEIETRLELLEDLVVESSAAVLQEIHAATIHQGSLLVAGIPVP